LLLRIRLSESARECHFGKAWRTADLLGAIGFPRNLDKSGATLALDGEIAVNGPKVEVLARLRDSTGSTVWSDRIGVRSDELFQVEDVIAERVVAALHLQLAAAEQERLRRRYTNNSAAYKGYLRGRAALVRAHAGGHARSRSGLRRRASNDSAYALARAGLAMASADMYLRLPRRRI
jgi:hypothetical protein